MTMGIDAARWLKYQSAVLYVALKTYKTVFDMPFFLFLAFDFCRFCVVIRFFITATKAKDLRL